jgi:DNA helicase-2/ATP-dependent DNA helicase PcrA
MKSPGFKSGLFFVIICLPMSILKSLNPEQQKAVKHVDGPLLIIAGAGSGKTRVLTHRIAYLIKEHNVPPSNILAVTFTNKAANEMNHRLNRLTGILSRQLWIGTFHSICGRILRHDIDKIGWRKDFLIFDVDDQESLIREIIKKLDLDDRFKPQVVLEKISKAKNELKGPKEYEATALDFSSEKLVEAYKLYQETLFKNNAMDFDDMLMFTVKLFRSSPATLESYQDRLRYINVDEYQDTNLVQYTLTNMLAKKHRNLCVVGDNDQSIYGWRGADFRNILNFERDYKDAKVILLEQNYRSTKTILDAANKVIANNELRKEKNLWTENPEGELIEHFTAQDSHGEARFITSEIKKLADKYMYNEFAILYRTNAQSRVLEEVFMQEGIPYRIVSGVKFYERAEIKDVLAYLRLIVNSKDNISASRLILNTLEGVGKGTLKKIEEIGEKENKSIFEVIQDVDKLVLTPKLKKPLQRFVDSVNGFKFDLPNFTASEMIEKVINESGYKKKLEEENSPEAISRVENIKELISVAKEFEKNSAENTLLAFLIQVSLMTDLDKLDESTPAVTLMTLHSAKGLEFPVVFIAGMEEGIFPHYRSLLEPSELEEERRLCYVGMTRAKNRLYMTSAEERLIFGENWYNGPSRFLEEIPSEFIRADAAAKEQEKIEINAPAEDIEYNFNVGDTINHPKFGTGEIMGLSGKGSELIIQVDFESAGEKLLMAKYAPLTKAS